MSESGWTAFSEKKPETHRRIDVSRLGFMGVEVERHYALTYHSAMAEKFTHWRYEESESRECFEPGRYGGFKNCQWHDIRSTKPKHRQPILLTVFGANGTIIDIIKRDYSEKDTPVAWSHWCSVDVLPKVPVLKNKEDYCHEAWKWDTSQHEFTYSDWQYVWNIAIATAKKHGLENV